MALQSRWTDLATERLQILRGRSSKCNYALSSWNSRLMKSLLALFPFPNSLGTSLLLSHVKNLVIGNEGTWFVYSKRRLLTQHMQELLQMWPGPFPTFWVGPGDKATFNVAAIFSGHLHMYHTTICHDSSRLLANKSQLKWCFTGSTL